MLALRASPVTLVTCLVTCQGSTLERMRKSSVLLALSLAVLLPAFVQGEDAPPRITNDFVQQQFGKDFTLVPEIGVLVGDLDGDGVEDAVIAARCRNPLLDEAEYNYTVLDPYYSFYGYGNPKVTMSFGDDNPARRGLVVLIIHGAGSEAWRAAKPKAKFVIINLPYRALSVRKMRLGKKTVQAVYTEERNEEHETSAMFFDGKKYKYVPMGSSME